MKKQATALLRPVPGLEQSEEAVDVLHGLGTVVCICLSVAPRRNMLCGLRRQ